MHSRHLGPEHTQVLCAHGYIYVHDMFHRFAVAHAVHERAYAAGTLYNIYHFVEILFFNQLFKKVVSNWFLPSGQGKTLVNTMIDFVNLGVVERNGYVPVVYMTEDGPFVDLVLSIDDDKTKLTKDFYLKYYKKTNAFRPL